MLNSGYPRLKWFATTFLPALILTLSGSFVFSTWASADGGPNCSEDAIAEDGKVSLDWCARDGDRHDPPTPSPREDRKSTRLNSSHVAISYAVFCLKRQKETRAARRRW